MTRPAPLAFPLASLLSEPPGSDRVLAIEGVTIPLDDDLTLAQPISGEVRVARTNRGVLVRGQLRAALAETCSRCLRPALTPVRLAIDEEALPAIDIATGRVFDLSSEPDTVRLTDHHELDLEPLLREAISLAEPIAPLCEPDCPGLCIECGERLGATHRAHEADVVDPRLEALRGFRVDATAENE